MYQLLCNVLQVDFTSVLRETVIKVVSTKGEEILTDIINNLLRGFNVLTTYHIL